MLDVVLGEPGGLISSEGLAAIQDGYGLWPSEEAGLLFRLEEAGVPAMAGSMGVAALEEIAPGFRARGALPSFSFSIAADRAITMEKFGRLARCRRIDRPVANTVDLTGPYESDETGLFATVGEAGEHWMMRVS
ncbi:hypothetical protein [Pararhizobium sp. PWRC1-1]|uniref:hypothetical protein n=1 Tax=Pararhizobium sp. PWRC1-1 TaxID=2804566 RepID=UPI003CFA474F